MPSGIKCRRLRIRRDIVEVGIAAQPHWHLDTGVMAGYSRPTPPVARSPEVIALEEIVSDASPALLEIEPVSGIQELDISGMHLGMGAGAITATIRVAGKRRLVRTGRT